MSDQSGQEDDLASDVADSPVVQIEADVAMAESDSEVARSVLAGATIIRVIIIVVLVLIVAIGFFCLHIEKAIALFGLRLVGSNDIIFLRGAEPLRCVPDDEDYKALYCWPDTTLHANFIDRVGEDYMLDFPPLPAVYNVPIWPMVQYSFDSGLDMYQRAKRYHEKNIGREAVSASPLKSSEGESIYEQRVMDARQAEGSGT
ncbi:hypothetical protein F4801DRAFT_573575 [Xylaria longipes]|nr:hypothetical protein F4801DRAFT_573575 [Xylaria longipes]